MSTLENEIGHRMRMVRNETGFSQAKVAAILGLSDRAYKTYELGKREPSLSTVLKFCEIFEVELTWLAYGEQQQEKNTPSFISLASGTVLAVYKETMNDVPQMSPKQFQKFFEYVFEQARRNDAIPEDEAKKIHQIFSNSETEK
nr:helix-turn-helix transcriptional regulator [uncultured Celeribacter sp.]